MFAFSGMQFRRQGGYLTRGMFSCLEYVVNLEKCTQDGAAESIPWRIPTQLLPIYSGVSSIDFKMRFTFR